MRMPGMIADQQQSLLSTHVINNDKYGGEAPEVAARFVFGSGNGRPFHRLQRAFAWLPKVNALGMKANDLAHPFGVRVELRMAQEAPDEKSSVSVVEIEPDKTVGWVDQRAIEVILVVRKEGRVFAAMKKRDDFGILDAGTRPIADEEPEWDAPFTQLLALIVPDVFIQQIHAAAGNSSGWRRRPCRSSKERRARLTLSAMAERVIFPSQALTISAGDMPWASSSRICQTMMRVPLKVGLPWQISGSATMCSPSSRRLGLPFALVFISLHWSFVWPSVICKRVVKTWSADAEKPEVHTDGVTQPAATDNNSFRSQRYFEVADQ